MRLELETWLEQLARAHTLVDVARSVLTLREPRAFGMELLDESGQPLVTLANAGSREASWAQHYVDGAWQLDPSMPAVRERHVLVAFLDLKSSEGAPRANQARGTDAPVMDLHRLMVGPVMSRSRVVGVVRFLCSTAVTPEARDIARAICGHISVRLAELGFGADERTHQFALLTTRQREIVSLVGEGLRSGEIGDALAISVNTVKKHLKAIFEIVGVETRAELAAIAGRSGASIDELRHPHDGVHIGWSRRGS